MHTIVVVAPSNYKSGGPESLHLLANKLKYNFGLNSYIYYFPNPYQPTKDLLEEYKLDPIFNLEDHKNLILITFESYPFINFLQKFKKAKKIIWWLSVDNFYISLAYYSKKFRSKISKNLLKRSNNIFALLNIDAKKYVQSVLSNIDIHLVQTYYSFENLKFLKIPIDKIMFLTNHINKDFIYAAEQFNKTNKKNIVIFNPIKSNVFTKKILENLNKNNNIDIIPLKEKSKYEIINILKESKVYIDFGFHPGKERLPREAALLDNCILVSKRGSAAYYEDLPIPDGYKFPMDERYIPAIVEKIKFCLFSYQIAIQDFTFFKLYVKNELNLMSHQLKRLLKTII